MRGFDKLSAQQRAEHKTLCLKPAVKPSCFLLYGRWQNRATTSTLLFKPLILINNVFPLYCRRFSTKHYAATIARQFPLCPHTKEKSGAKCHILLLPSGTICSVYRCKLIARNYIFHISRKCTWKLPGDALVMRAQRFHAAKSAADEFVHCTPMTARRIFIISTGF